MFNYEMEVRTFVQKKLKNLLAPGLIFAINVIICPDLVYLPVASLNSAANFKIKLGLLKTKD
jgi:hypothetical protein